MKLNLDRCILPRCKRKVDSKVADKTRERIQMFKGPGANLKTDTDVTHGTCLFLLWFC